MDRRFIAAGAAVLVIIILLAALVTLSPSHPKVVIDSPASNSQFYDGQTVAVESTSTDSAGISRVELYVDGVLVRTDQAPGPVDTFTINQTWKATPGPHTITVRAYNVSNTPSAPALVQVAVLSTTAPAAAPTLTPGVTVQPSASPAPTTACTDDAALVADVTVPDGTVLGPSQGFDKTWRVRNTGTCTWGNGYLFTFIGGQAMTKNTAAPVPVTPPGGTADLTVAMVAPATAGRYMGLWRLQGSNGAVFGATLAVNIIVPGKPTPARCSGVPNIASFTVSPSTITAGQSATLNWGFVSNADQADIDQGIGGVATPGKTTVSPTTTTTYTLTAHCGPVVQTAQVTLAVLPTPTATSSSVPTATPVPPATATPNPAQSPAARVNSNLTGTLQGSNFIPGDIFARDETVWIQMHTVDANGANLAGARVLFTVLNSNSSAQCPLESITTDANGTALGSCKIASNAPTGTWDVHVDGVIKIGFPYDPANSATDHNFTVR